MRAGGPARTGPLAFTRTFAHDDRTQTRRTRRPAHGAPTRTRARPVGPRGRSARTPRALPERPARGRDAGDGLHRSAMARPAPRGFYPAYRASLPERRAPPR